MIKKIFSILLFLCLACPVFAASGKIAVVDIQKVVNNSTQVKILTKEHEARKKELASLIKRAGDEIKRESDPAKKKAIASKYEQQIKLKTDTNAKAYKTKLEAIDKSISASIAQQAKALGYDMVLTKGVVLYGGVDITDSIMKVIK